jgi:cyclopropane fatty-acyl-phospholipid synthase-like methyltransferase
VENYERYQGSDSQQIAGRDILYYLCRKPSDRVIVPLLKNIADKRIVEVGIGAGYYTRYLMERNEVLGIDQNPQLCELPVEIRKGDATQLNEAVNERKFDLVLSMWMTEYLNHEQLQAFLCQARQLLDDKGMLLTTIIADKGVGWLYIIAAKTIRHVVKYCYNVCDVETMMRQAGFGRVEIKTLNARLGLPWAYLVEAQV